MKKLYYFLMICALTVLSSSLTFTNASAAEPDYNPSRAYQNGTYYQKLKAVSLGDNQNENLVAVALSQVGYHEGNNLNDISGTSKGSKNFTEYANTRYGVKGGANWCAYFVSWSARQAGIPANIIPNAAGVGTLRNGAGTYYDISSGYQPVAGDLFLLEPVNNNGNYYVANRVNGKANLSSHVGIVTGYDSGSKRVYFVEGNSGYNNVRSSNFILPSQRGNNLHIQGFMHPSYTKAANAAPAAQPKADVRVNFADYLAKQSIGTTNAVLAKTITVENTSINSVSKVGIILYDSSGRQLASKGEKPVPVGNKINAWYDVNLELKCQLAPGTTYQYKFYAVVNGLTYYSTTWSFRTNAAVTVNFSAYAKKYWIGQTNAVLSRTITVQNASIKDVSKVGIALYNVNWQYIGGKTEKPIPVGNQINAWYNVNSELWVRLNRRTKYYYRFQTTLGGTTYYGDWMTFTTK
ncbi:MAG: CHAP domain-containing protein [Lachnospiraceae bacterium]|nr:CHAP domain-containing protein [Lachnospiraceae bacterium]